MSDPKIEDIYPLSPVQHGMLFHSVQQPDSGVYAVQLRCTLRAPCDLGAFKQAWAEVIARHAVLRTLFLWERRDEPLQVVRRQARLSWTELDWSDQEPARQRATLDSWCAAEHRRSFDLGRAPLMRCALIRLSETSVEWVWTHHHLLLDGWSGSLLLREVSARYAALRRGESLALEPPTPYGAYIAWLRQQDLAQAETFWRAELRGIDAPTPLIVDRHADRGDQTARFDAEEIALPHATTAALEGLARRAQLTLNTLVQSAWAILLSRYSGQDEVVFGIAGAGRPAALPGVEQMVGLFINTLPLRLRVPRHGAALPWLRQVQARQVALRQFEYAPLVQIQGWSDLPRGQPLFESVLVFKNFPAVAANSGPDGLSLDEVRVTETTSYPLAVVATVGPTLSLSIGYDCARFDRATIRRMLGHLRWLLEQLAAEPQPSLAHIALLPSDERAELLHWNATATPYPADRCLHELFEQQAARTPEAIAAVYEDQGLTYSELDRQATALARRLHRRGIGAQPPGEPRVALIVERSLDMLVGLLGILKAGGAYVPLDPAYPSERLSFVLQDMAAALVVTQAALVPRLAALSDQAAGANIDSRLVLLDVAPDDTPPADEATPLRRPDPAQLAYVISTSGSTGRPKGVQIEHRAAVNFLSALAGRGLVTAEDTLVAVTTLAFDIALLELLLPLVVGGKVVIASREVAADGAALSALLKRWEATALQATPITWRLLLEAGWAGSPQLKLLCGGEALPVDLAHELRPRGAALWNLYGPTETTVWSTIHQLHTSVPPISIGRPIANTAVYVLDAQGQPAPVGVPGELYIGGAGVARGYLNRPALTAERFGPDPFGAHGARLYRTGDIARWLPDGTLEHLGRSDQQVKLHGFRIELGEIETALRDHPAVRDAAVIVREPQPGQQRLVAYVVGGIREDEPGGAPSMAHREQSADAESLTPDPRSLAPGELRQFLSTRLPDYMVPSAFVTLDALPLTANGKLDRRALPDLAASRLDERPPFVAPATPEEQTLAAIWSQVLRVAQVGVHDNFYDLGGDSFLIMRVVSKANQAGLRIKVRQLAEHQTIAAVLAVASPDEPRAAASPLSGPLPMTVSQRQFLALALPHRERYNIAILLETRARYTPALWATAIQQLIVHHAALRARLTANDSSWRQEVGPPPDEPPLSLVDLSGASAAEQQATIERVTYEVQTSFRLEQGPLLRAVLFERGPLEPPYLLLAGHYWAVDVASWHILAGDLQAACQALSQGTAVELAPGTSLWERTAQLRRYAQSPAGQREAAYWLAPARWQVAPLPRDHAAGANTVASARTAKTRLDAVETEQLLRVVAAARPIQIDAVLLTAITQAISEWAGSRALLVNLVGHGRDALADDADLSRTVGWLNVVYPVLCDLSAAQHSGAALTAIHSQLRAVPGGGIGYGALRYFGDDAALAADLGRMPAAEVVFNYVGPRFQFISELPLFGIAGLSGGHRHDPDGARRHLIEITAYIDEEQLQIDWDYSIAVHQPATIAALVERCLAVVRALVNVLEAQPERDSGWLAAGPQHQGERL